MTVLFKPEESNIFCLSKQLMFNKKDIRILVLDKNIIINKNA